MTMFPDDVRADAKRLRSEWLNIRQPDMGLTGVEEAIAIGIMHGRSQLKSNIKPLEWVASSDGDLTAKTPFGLFEVIEFNRRKIFVFAFKLKDRSHHGTLNDAKTAAEKYYAALTADLFMEKAP